MTDAQLEWLRELEESSTRRKTSSKAMDDLIVEVEEKLTNSVYEQFTNGRLTGDQLVDAFRTIHKWSHFTQEMLLKWGSD